MVSPIQVRRDSLTDQTELQELLAPIAPSLVKASGVQAGEAVGVIYNYVHEMTALQVGEEIRRRGGIPSFCCRNLAQDVERAREMPINQFHEFHAAERAITSSSGRLILLAGGAGDALSTLSDKRRAAYDKEWAMAYEPRVKGTVPWLVTMPPTPEDAQFEELSFLDYVRIFATASNQPWVEIKQTQQLLVEKLNHASSITFRANQFAVEPRQRTEISMSIRDMTFCNSTVQRNFPGSEVFSAPVLHSVQGQICAPGLYMYDRAKMTNIFLRVENGKVVEGEAEVGNEHLQRILNTGTSEASRFFGEVAIGTNPGLRRRLVNPLLAEKTAGSFHMALGHCYTHTYYDGRPVHVNNGNTSERTSVHWDLTVLMHPENGGGEILLDGDVIQKDGLFVDPRLQLLNFR